MKKKNKYVYLYVLQGDYGQGWEDLTAEETRKEIRSRLIEYLENEGGTYRIINRRELKDFEDVAQQRNNTRSNDNENV